MAISKPYISISPPYQGNLTEKQEDLDAWADKTVSLFLNGCRGWNV